MMNTLGAMRPVYRWRHTKCRVNLDEVLGEMIERDRCRMIFQSATETVRQAGVAAHRRTNRPVLNKRQRVHNG